MALKKRVTIYDIAKELNINPSSVSRALNNDPKINALTRKKVSEAAKALNYKRNSVAQTLRTGRTKTIGIVVPKINQNFFSNVIAGIEQELYPYGYNIIICQSNESYLREVDCIDTLIDKQVDCIVISISFETKDSSHLKSVLDNHIELIQFDRVLDDLDTFKVINGNYDASYHAVKHMIDQGYERIALLEGPQNLSIFRDRKSGYISALQDNGLPVLTELIFANSSTKALGKDATQQLLTMSDPPDAIFASTSDFSALGVFEVAQAMNIKIPQQLGICGYSNEDFTAITTPSITTIDQHSVEMGKNIVNLYFNYPEQNGTIVEKIINVPPTLVIRSSTLRNVNL